MSLQSSVQRSRNRRFRTMERGQSTAPAMRTAHIVPRWPIAALWLTCAAMITVPALNRWYARQYAVPYLRLTVALWGPTGGFLRVQQDRAYRDAAACVRSLSPAGMETVNGMTYYAVRTCERVGASSESGPTP